MHPIGRAPLIKMLTAFAGGILLSGSPAAAQDPILALDPTTMVGYAGTVAAGEYAQREFGGRLAAPKRARSESRPANPAQFAFRPDPAVRQQVYARAIARAQKVSPADARKIRRMLLSGEVHRNATSYLARYGMSANNLADTLALHLAVAWFATRASDGDPSRAQMLGLRRQVTNVLSDTPGFAKASNATKQEIAEANIVQATFNGSVANAAARDPKLAAKARQAVARDIMSTYRINLLKLNLTNQGLR
jgi:hypothetical protein